jgi:hypothetical protein
MLTLIVPVLFYDCKRETVIPPSNLHQWRSLERDSVADVGEAGDAGEGALEAEAEAGVRDRVVTAQIAVPGVVLLVDAALSHGMVQYLEPFLALAAADDLANPRRQYVHCGERASSFTRM